MGGAGKSAPQGNTEPDPGCVAGQGGDRRLPVQERDRVSHRFPVPAEFERLLKKSFETAKTG